jgi:general nucleoside transport system ATP-binding protein
MSDLSEADQPAIELTGICKRFGAVQANRDVSLRVVRGSIHGIVGENGAGKSTLMSILYGFYEADEGDIRVAGRPIRIRTSKEAIAAGIGMVFQHFMLVDTLSVVENVLLGAEGGPWLRGGERAVRRALAGFAADYGLTIDPDALVGDLSVGLQQRVEILKALYRGADILILDEPTAVLAPSEADQLFALLAALKVRGKTVILITHKLREIMAVTDSVSVMRKGEMVATLATAKTSPADIAELMVGRRVLMRVEKGACVADNAAQPALGIDHLDLIDQDSVTRLKDISLSVRAGEIVGIAGVAGNGQSELLAVLAGLVQPTSGSIRLYGDLLSAHERHPRRLRQRGVMHVPEDRHKAGLVTTFPAYENGILGYHDQAELGSGPFLSPVRMQARMASQMAAYDIRPPSPDLKTSKFSGGNQQKIVLAREIDQRPRVLLVGQPTRGVDIGAIEAIHKRMIALRDAGVAILLVSVELDEIMGLSDRIVVMCGGRITGERLACETDERDLGLLMAGVDSRNLEYAT